MERKRTNWDIFVNGYFLPEDEVVVSDRLLGSFLIITSQLFVLFVGWCAEGFSLINLIKSDNSCSSSQSFSTGNRDNLFCFLFRLQDYQRIDWFCKIQNYATEKMGVQTMGKKMGLNFKRGRNVPFCFL
jgi:hypothetical protein